MKRTLLYSLLALFLLASCSQYKVYSVRERPSRTVTGGLLYALPHTTIRVAVTIDHTDYSAAPYAMFAEEMLGLVAPSADSVFFLRSIEVSTYNTADPNAYYFVAPRRTVLEIDNRGLLRAIGCRSSQPLPANNADLSPETFAARPVGTVAEYNLYDRVDTFYTRNDAPGHPSMVLAAKDVRSLRQRAQAAAERIEEIRERKEALLFGEYEGSYAAENLSFLYQQLEQMEQKYLEQFVGVCKSETVVFLVDPADQKGSIEDQTIELFRFNPAVGVVDSTDEEALSVWCNIHCDNSLRKAARFVKYRTRSTGKEGYFDRRSFKYRVPETATVTIFSDEFSFLREVKVSQFGTVTSLPAGRCEAQFDPVTGDLIYYK